MKLLKTDIKILSFICAMVSSALVVSIFLWYIFIFIIYIYGYTRVLKKKLINYRWIIYNKYVWFKKKT
jgi:hypothetical protein